MGGNEMQREKERVAAIMQQKQAAGKPPTTPFTPEPSEYYDLGFMLILMDSRGKESSRSRGWSEEIDSTTILTSSLVSDAASMWVLRG